MQTALDASELEQLRQLLGADLARFAGAIPVLLARELLRGDAGYLAPYQLTESLLCKLRPEMRDWTTPDVLRTLAPASPLARNRMQAVAGAIAPLSCRAHPAFCYYPYIPVGHVASGAKEAGLIIAVHGSSRNPKDMRDAYAAFAERHGCFVLAPLFPLDLDDDAPDEAYKQLVGRTVRYDRVIWSMVDELAAITDTRFTRIVLFGFSGGAQFAQRLLYVSPHRLNGVSIAAPTYLTLPDRSAGWWTGLADFEMRFGHEVDFAAMRQVSIQLLCGSDDVLDCDVYRRDELGLHPARWSAYGRNRRQRIDALRRAYAHIGIEAEQDIVQGASHAFAPLLEASKPFIARVLHAA